MKNQPNEATVKDGFHTAERILNDHLWMGTEPAEAQSAILAAMQKYSDQQNAELRERLTKLQYDLKFEKDVADDALKTQEEQLIALRDQISDLDRENNNYRLVYDSVVKNRDDLREMVFTLQAKIASYESSIDGLKKVVDSLYNLKS